MPENELLNCPFCNEVPKIYPIDSNKEGGAFGQVRCENQECVANPVVNDGENCSDDRGSEVYKSIAIARWNTRAPDSKLTEAENRTLNGAIDLHIKTQETLRASWGKCEAENLLLKDDNDKKFDLIMRHGSKIKELEAKQQWQPIENCKIDGYILVARNDYSGIRIVFRADDRVEGYYLNYLDDELNCIPDFFPAYWMPLPESKQALSGGEG